MCIHSQSVELQTDLTHQLWRLHALQMVHTFSLEFQTNKAKTNVQSISHIQVTVSLICSSLIKEKPALSFAHFMFNVTALFSAFTQWFPCISDLNRKAYCTSYCGQISTMALSIFLYHCVGFFWSTMGNLSCSNSPMEVSGLQGNCPWYYHKGYFIKLFPPSEGLKNNLKRLIVWQGHSSFSMYF